MTFARAASALALSAFALTGCDTTTSIELADLAGFWNATQFAYADDSDDDTGFVLNVVSPSVGGDVSLDVEESGDFTGSVLIPGVTLDPSTGQTTTYMIGGAITLVDQETLHIDFDTATEAVFSDFDAAFTLEGDVLTFVNDDTMFDFKPLEDATGTHQGRGPVPATLTVTLER